MSERGVAHPIVALTGGIGSGKSYVCQCLKAYGITVYDCDKAAKRLMRDSALLRQQLIQLVGEKVYQGQDLQRAVLAQFLLESEVNKQRINDVVHPAVASDFLQSGMEWLESAILYESGFVHRVPFTHVVCVTAPLEVRVQRVQQRDGLTEEKAMKWVKAQMAQEEMAQRAHFIITNDGQCALKPQIEELLSAIYPSSSSHL